MSSKKANICIGCKNAVPDNRGHGCPWSENFDPVPGWTAKKVILNPGRIYDETETYQITACPLFDPDKDFEARSPMPANAIKIRCLETGEVFPSLNAAAKSVGGCSANFTTMIKLGRMYFYGRHWEVVREEEK